jgi:transcriptional regulator with XRE-family HTH domain
MGYSPTMGRKGHFRLTDTDFDTNLSPFARRLRRARLDADLTQADLAAGLGVSQPSVHAWERGECMPRAGLFPHLARVLRVTLDDLFRES